MSGEALAGTTMPFHTDDSKPGTALASAGTPGTSGEGRALVTAMALSLPVATCCATGAHPLNSIWICPPMRSVTEAESPL